MSIAKQPELAAALTLAALGRKSRVIPGVFSKLLTYSMLPMPRFARTRVLAGVMRNMTGHQALRLGNREE